VGTWLELVSEEIRRLERVLEAVVEPEGARRAPATWEADERTLSWHVVLEGALEPDIDVEVLPRALVVRVLAASAERPTRASLLPIPEAYDPPTVTVRFEPGVLHVVVRRRGRT
jgi:hypothetical protein